jgi:hypothetical protein
LWNGTEPWIPTPPIFKITWSLDCIFIFFALHKG